MDPRLTSSFAGSTWTPGPVLRSIAEEVLASNVRPSQDNMLLRSTLLGNHNTPSDIIHRIVNQRVEGLKGSVKRRYMEIAQTNPNCPAEVLAELVTPRGQTESRVQTLDAAQHNALRHPNMPKDILRSYLFSGSATAFRGVLENPTLDAAMLDEANEFLLTVEAEHHWSSMSRLTAAYDLAMHANLSAETFQKIWALAKQKNHVEELFLSPHYPMTEFRRMAEEGPLHGWHALKMLMNPSCPDDLADIAYQKAENDIARPSVFFRNVEDSRVPLRLRQPYALKYARTEYVKKMVHEEGARLDAAWLHEAYLLLGTTGQLSSRFDREFFLMNPNLAKEDFLALRAAVPADTGIVALAYREDFSMMEKIEALRAVRGDAELFERVVFPGLNAAQKAAFAEEHPNLEGMPAEWIWEALQPAEVPGA